MAKLSLALAAALAASASAFAPAPSSMKKTALSAEQSWDPLSLGKLGQGEAFDTFPGMFPDYQFLNEAEIKHGRMSMLAWTGIWATHVVSAFCSNPLDCIELYCPMAGALFSWCTLFRHYAV
jgi:Chlorophyll A-B binding protein